MEAGHRRWLTDLREAAAGQPPTQVLGLLAWQLARQQGVASVIERVARLWPSVGGGPCLGPSLPASAGPDLLGEAYEALAEDDQRRRGLHYTPRRTAERLVALALDDLEPGPRTAPSAGRPVLCDPTCGGGAFLLAAARHLAARGVAPATVVDQHLVGIDLDPVAVAVATTALCLWAGDGEVEPRVAPADALLAGEWPHRPAGGFDVVVGNPPFQGQLAAATTRGAEARAELRRRFGARAAGYVDTAALFLVAGVEQVRPGGRVLLVQPQSVLASRDAGPVRRWLDEMAPLDGLWVCDEPVFEAAVRVCAPRLRVGEGGGRQVARWWGPKVDAAPPASPAPSAGVADWASLVAGLRGAPTLALRGAPLAEAKGATAGFRDQFYGLAPHVREAGEGADQQPGDRPLVTAGLIEPARCDWSVRDARFAGRDWRAPVVDVAGLQRDDPALAAWVQARLVPKVLVATQTRVLEAVVDVEGRWVPSTPVIAVPVDPDRLWHVAAVLSAPPVTAWALHASAGTALAPGALKVSATQVRAVPTPTDPRAWDDGAQAMRQAQEASSPEALDEALLAMALAMAAAYEVEDPDGVVAWWQERRRRRPRPVARSTDQGTGR